MKNYALVKEEHPVVETIYGKVMGENRKGVAIFRGIHYGATTAGKNRFCEPKEPEHFEGIKDCYTKNGDLAPQNSHGSVARPDVPYWNGGTPEKFKTETEERSEDCLVLNVLTPGIDDRKRSVVVYIHGGGFTYRSGTLTLGADDWVREQDIVVVGINHRLNIFGYLYLGDVDKRFVSSGMAGMLDLVLALKWVNRNIEKFGGDPSKVTIMGESGGAMKVSTLMDMPECEGLFRAAIVISGSSPTAALSREEAAEVTRKVMEYLNVTTVEELQEVSEEKLLEAFSKFQGYRWSPVADDIHLMSNPSGKFRKPVIDVPVLVGSSEDEMGVFMSKEELDFGWDELKDRLMKYEDRHGSLNVTEEQMDHIIDVFKKTDTKNNDAPHLYMKIVSLASSLGGGAFYQAMCEAENNLSPVFHYVIRFDAPFEKDWSKHYSWHTADLPLTMRVVTFPEETLKMSLFYSNAWGNFIKNLDPSIEGLKWDRFDTEKRLTMVIDDECRIESDPLREIRETIEPYVK